MTTIKEQISDHVAFVKYGSILLAMLAGVLLYACLCYAIVSYAYSVGGQVAGLMTAISLFLLTILLGRRISA